MNEQDKKEPTVKNIPANCKNCKTRKCEDLFWKEVLVLPGLFSAPIDCQLLVKDESRIRSALNSMNVDDISRISGELWIRSNFGPRYVHTRNREAEDIGYILSCWRQHSCIVLSRWQKPDYKPWTLFGFWMRSGQGSTDVQLKPLHEKEEECLTDNMADETPAQQDALSVTNPRWEHKDETLKKESSDFTHAGDTIILMVDIKGYVPGGRVVFDIYDISGSSPVRIDTVYGKNGEGKGSAEWVVEDPRKVDDTKELKLAFEGSARSKYCKKKEIGWEECKEFEFSF